MDTIGKYKIIRELGAGGFGAVYLAEDPNLGTQVAIKVFRVKDENLAGLATSASQDAGSILESRFLSEARTLEGLSHNPYIVNLKEFDKLDDGTPYYVMPHLPTSLEHEIGKDAFTRGKLEETPKELHPRKMASTKALDILKQILEGMSEVHRAGLIHRDIKPANILFDGKGNVQICDFGIAKLPDAEHSQSGVGMGSRNYMSPEQRESAKHVTPASDVYSIGVLAYRMLTGQLPLGKFQDAIAYAPEIGEKLNTLIDDALSQNESGRPKDAGDFLSRFTQALTEVSEGGVEDESTGTWIDEGKAEIKAELKPLKARIEKLLSEQGEIRDKDKPGLEALASVIGLEENELTAFVEQTIASFAQTSGTNAGLIKWIEGVNRRTAGTGKTIRNILSQEEYDAFMDVGLSTTGKEKGALEALLKAKGITVKQQGASQPGKKPQEQHQPTTGFSGGKWGIAIAAVLLVGVIGYFIYDSRPTTSTTASSTSQQKTVSTPTTTITEAPPTYPLTVSTTPSDARVQIMNITPGYYDGIQLEAGEYQLRVSKTGYQTKEQWVSLSQNSQRFSVTLEQDRPKHSAAVQALLDSMVTIPAGSFMMGSNDGADREKPVHRVTINPFRLMEHEVTWDMYQPCIDAGVCPDNQQEGADEGWGKGNRPVINVSWNDITQKYIPWLNQLTGQTFRLPTEAEWEYAARGRPGDSTKQRNTKYSWGNNINCTQASYDGGKDSACYYKVGDNLRGTAIVKSYQPNAFGLYDMHGNVWEWVQDCWNDSYGNAPANGSAWMRGDCDRTVLRGGSWFYEPINLRSATRNRYNRSNRFHNNGFRLAQDL